MAWFLWSTKLKSCLLNLRPKCWLSWACTWHHCDTVIGFRLIDSNLFKWFRNEEWAAWRALGRIHAASRGSARVSAPDLLLLTRVIIGRMALLLFAVLIEAVCAAAVASMPSAGGQPQNYKPQRPPQYRLWRPGPLFWKLGCVASLPAC